MESLVERLRCRVVAKGFSSNLDHTLDVMSDYTEYQNMVRFSSLFTPLDPFTDGA